MDLIDSAADDLKYEIANEASKGTRIKVIGVGGGGCNAVARMVAEGLEGVEFYAMNTDLQALTACPVPNKLQLGARITKGLGAGSNPKIGADAALGNTDEIVEVLQGADMVFVTAGLGGGTGTGAAPVIAGLARQLEALTIAIVTKPFAFEGEKRMKVAEQGLKELASRVDTVITIPNQRLLNLVPKGTSFLEAFKVADDLLRQAVQGISDIMVTPGMINRDFSDIKATMLGMGYAIMGTAVGKGDNAAMEAAKAAISCPLLEDRSIAGSRAMLINLTGSSKLGLHDVDAACSLIRDAAQCDDVQINFGWIVNEAMKDTVKITVIATGFNPDDGSLRDEAPGFPFIRADEQAQVRMDPAPPAPLVVEQEAEPMLDLEPEPVEAAIDLDDLEVPAYLRNQRRGR